MENQRDRLGAAGLKSFNDIDLRGMSRSSTVTHIDSAASVAMCCYGKRVQGKASEQERGESCLWADNLESVELGAARTQAIKVRAIYEVDEPPQSRRTL